MTLANVIKLEILERIESNIKRIYSIEKIPKLVIKLNENEQFGDFTTTAALQIKSTVNKSPLVIAKEITDTINLTTTKLVKVEVVTPGYINFYLEPNWKIKVLEDLIKSPIKIPESIDISKSNLDELNYIVQRIDTILLTLEKEKVIPNCEEIRWEHICLSEEKELLNLFSRVSANLHTFNKKELNILLEETIKKFYAYYNKLQFRKLEYPRINVVLNIFICIRRVLDCF